MCLSPCSSLNSTTSSVEELPGIFSRERKVPRNTAQQLYDVGYMVYEGEERKEEERKNNKENGEEEGDSLIKSKPEINSK